MPRKMTQLSCEQKNENLFILYINFFNTTYYLLQSYTVFEQYLVHHQEVKLY